MGEIRHYKNGIWTIYTTGEDLNMFTGGTPGTYYIGVNEGNSGVYTKVNPDGVIVDLESVGGIISILWSDLYTLVSGGLLSVGQKYLITDFRTRQVIPNTVDICLGITEPLIVEAVSVNTISEKVLSTIYQQDTIYYELDDTSGQGGDRGRIYYRKDNVINISTFYDWRNVIFRRWETINGSGIYDSVTDTGFASQDYYTFNNSPDATTCFNVSIGSNGTSLNNNVFGSNCYENTIGYGSSNNTIGSDFYLNVIGDGFSSNLIDTEFYSNKVGNGFTQNTVPTQFYRNEIQNNCQSNTFGSTTYENIIGNSYINNTTGSPFIGNRIGNGFNQNNIGNNSNNNKFGSDCFLNTIGEQCQGNVFESDATSNYIGAVCQLNIFGQSFGSNVIGNNCMYNQIGSQFGSNTIGNNFQSNQIGSQFNNNVLIFIGSGGNNFMNNRIGDYFENIQGIGDNFIGNVIGNNFKFTFVPFILPVYGDNFQDNVIGNNFINNTAPLTNFRKNHIESGLSSVSFAAATHVYNNYTCEIFLNDSIVYRLKYTNGTDTIVYDTPNA